MKIGLYFGSFNPIHVGHLIIANHAVNHTDVKQVWFVVSPQNPFKTSSSLLNEYHRLHLVKLAIDNEVKFKASNIEFKMPKPSYTIDTMTYLCEKHPQHEFSILMGSDGFQNLNKWKNFDFLVKNYRFIIFKRPKFEIKNHLLANIEILDAPLLEISSTYIRNLIHHKKSIKYLVPDLVMEEIENNGYYKG